MDPLTRDLFSFPVQQQVWRWFYSGFYESLKTAGCLKVILRAHFLPLIVYRKVFTPAYRLLKPKYLNKSSRKNHQASFTDVLLVLLCLQKTSSRKNKQNPTSDLYAIYRSLTCSYTWKSLGTKINFKNRRMSLA